MNPAALSNIGQLSIDLSGLNCPLPVLKTKAALTRIGPGELLEVIATHPDSVREFELLCKRGDLRLEGFSDAGGRYIYLIRKLK